MHPHRPNHGFWFHSPVVARVYAKWELVSRGYILYDFISITFSMWQNHSAGEYIGPSRALGLKELTQRSFLVGGDGAVLWPGCGDSDSNLYMWRNYTELYTDTHTHTHYSKTRWHPVSSSPVLEQCQFPGLDNVLWLCKMSFREAGGRIRGNPVVFLQLPVNYKLF